MRESLQAIETQLHALWMQSLQGDSTSYERVLSLLARSLRSYMRKRLASQSGDVEDLVQETLMAIHLKRHTYQSDQPLSAWVYAIARYKWIDHLRSQGRHELLHDDIDDWADILPADSDAEAGESQRDLAGMLSALPDKQRVAIECTRLQGLSIRETAQLTGQSEASVKVNVHRGLKTLMEKWRTPS